MSSDFPSKSFLVLNVEGSFYDVINLRNTDDGYFLVDVSGDDRLVSTELFKDYEETNLLKNGSLMVLVFALYKTNLKSFNFRETEDNVITFMVDCDQTIIRPKILSGKLLTSLNKTIKRTIAQHSDILHYLDLKLDKIWPEDPNPCDTSVTLGSVTSSPAAQKNLDTVVEQPYPYEPSSTAIRQPLGDATSSYGAPSLAENHNVRPECDRSSTTTTDFLQEDNFRPNIDLTSSESSSQFGESTYQRDGAAPSSFGESSSAYGDIPSEHSWDQNIVQDDGNGINIYMRNTRAKNNIIGGQEVVSIETGIDGATTSSNIKEVIQSTSKTGDFSAGNRISIRMEGGSSEGNIIGTQSAVVIRQYK